MQASLPLPRALCPILSSCEQLSAACLSDGPLCPPPPPRAEESFIVFSLCVPSSPLRWPGYCLVQLPVGQAHGIFGCARQQLEGKAPQPLFFSHEVDETDKQTKKQMNATPKPQLFYGPFNDERLTVLVLVLLL